MQTKPPKQARRYSMNTLSYMLEREKIAYKQSCNNEVKIINSFLPFKIFGIWLCGLQAGRLDGYVTIQSAVSGPVDLELR